MHALCTLVCVYWLLRAGLSSLFALLAREDVDFLSNYISRMTVELSAFGVSACIRVFERESVTEKEKERRGEGCCHQRRSLDIDAVKQRLPVVNVGRKEEGHCNCKAH